MTIHEKLERLTRFASRSAVSKAAGFGTATLATTLARRSGVTTDMAAAFARVLGVDPAWLMDDRRSWPPLMVPDISERSESREANEPIRAA